MYTPSIWPCCIVIVIDRIVGADYNNDHKLYYNIIIINYAHLDLSIYCYIIISIHIFFLQIEQVITIIELSRAHTILGSKT